MALIQKAFSDIITFSRSSNATRIGPNGLVQYAPHNLSLRSQEFDNASWTKSGATVTANAIAAPDGTVTADKMIESATTAVHGLYQTATVVANTPHTVSVYAKAGERNWLVINPFTTGSSYVYFDLANGVVGTIGSGITASIQSVGNGWYRCIATRTPTTTYFEPNIQVTTANGTPSYAGDGTSGIYLWGAQLSVGPYALDYTPTTSAAVYGPRFDYDPVTLAARGLLVEEQRTNLLVQSQDFSTTWTNTRTTETVDATTAPDGTVTADKLVEDTSASNDHVITQTATVSISTTYTYSVFIKASERTWAFLNMVDVGISSYRSWFNLSTGVVGTSDSGNTASIQSVGNGWYRCIVSRATTGSQTSMRCEIGLSTGDNVINYTGNGTSGLFIWGAQLEAGAFATSYIPTVASTVTRSADVASVDTVSPWYSGTESTLFAEFDIIGAGSPQTIASLQASAVADGLLLYKSGTGLNMLAIVDASSVTLGTLSLNAAAKVALAYNGSANGAVLNGGSVSSVGTTVSAAATKLSIGASFNGTANKLNGHLRRIAYYPRRLTNAEIQALTA